MNIPSLSGQFRWLPLSLLLGIIALICNAAAEPHEAPPYRQIYVPQEDIANQTAGRIEVTREEFDQLVAAATSDDTHAPPQAPARLQSASFYARLEHDTLVEGSALLSIEHNASSAASLDLGPCHLPIHDASWVDAPDASPLLGCDAEGNWQVQVNRDGKLAFAWTLQGRINSSEESQFSLQFPPSPSTFLSLDLPEEVRPISSTGMVQLASEAAPLPSQERLAPPAPGDRRWSINLGGHSTCNLLIAPEEKAASQPLVVSRQFDKFAIEDDGVAMTTEIQLDVHHRALRALHLEIDARLRIKEIRVGGQKASWSLTEEAPEGSKVIRTNFEEALTGVEKTVQIIGFAPVDISEPFTLPSIVPRDMFWQEGKALIVIGRQHLLTHLELTSCHQYEIHSLPPPQAGQQIGIAYFDPRAEISLAASRQPGQIFLESGISVQLSESSITGQLIADFRSDSAERFALEALIPSQWVIDDLSTEPASALKNWNTRNESEGWQRLHIDLQEALSPNRPLRLIVQAHRLPVPPSVELPIEQLRIAQFEGINHANRLVEIIAKPPYQLVSYGENELTQRGHESLSKEELSRIDGQAESFLFDDSPAASSLRIAIETQRVRYSANIHLAIEVEPDMLEARMSLQCIPDATPVSQILVHITAPVEHQVQWRIAGETESSLEERLLTAKEQRDAGFASGGQTWQLTLGRPRTLQFEIRGILRSAWKRKTALPLMALRGADRQRATLDISIKDAALAQILAAEHLVRLPLENPRLDRSSRLVARYQYDPVRDVFASSQPVLSINALPEYSDPANLIAWNMELHSILGMDGQVDHIARYALENSGRAHVGIRLNPSMVLEGIAVDGHRLSLGKEEMESGALQIPLPEGVRFPLLEIDYTSVGKRPRWRTPIEIPSPQIDIPILAREGMLWLPPETSPCNLSEEEHSAGWMRRLFGPLAREKTEEPINFFNPSHWRIPSTVPREMEESSEASTRLLQEIGRLLASRQPPATWGALLSASTLLTENSNASPLFIDRRRLSMLGIESDTQIQDLHFERVSNNLQRGAALLRRHALCLLLSPEGLMITSPGHLQPGASQTVDLGGAGVVYLVKDAHEMPPLSTERAENRSGESVRFLTVKQWLHLSSEKRPLWKASSPLAVSLGTGWRPQFYRPDAYAPQVLFVTEPANVHVLAWLAFFLAAGIAVLIARRGEQAWILLAAGAAAVALLGPAFAVPITSSLFLGTCAGGIGALFRNKTKTPPINLPASDAPSPLPLLLMGAFLVGLLAYGTSAWAQPPSGNEEDEVKAPARDPGDTAPYSVIIPVDEDREPVGDAIFVPQAVYQNLRRHEAEQASPNQGWLLLSATYHASIRHVNTDAPAELREMTAHYKAEVLRSEVLIQLPFNRERINLPIDGIRVNGEPVEATWSEDDSLLQIFIEESGSYELEIHLLPTSGAATSGSFSTPIALVPDSRLHLQIPSELGGIEIPSALGLIRREEDNVEADLGPASSLSLRWGQSGSIPSNSTNVIEEQLYWLHVRPGEVSLQVKFQLRNGRGQRAPLILHIDPRLRMIPVDGARVKDDDPEIIIINPASWGGEAAPEIILSFILDETSGVGNLRLPLLAPKNAPVLRRMLAVSVDPSLSDSRTPHDQIQPIEAALFLAEWGPSEATPSMTFQLLSDEADWRLTTTPRASLPTSEESNLWIFDTTGAHVQYRADIEIETGQLFEHQIKAPKKFVVNHLSLWAEGEERVWQWSQGKNGVIHVFANKAISGPHRIQIEGFFESLPGRRANIRPLALMHVEADSKTLSVERSPSILCRILKTTSCTRLNEADLPFWEEESTTPDRPSRKVGDWRLRSDEASVRVAINRNNIQLQGDLITVIDHDETWKAMIELSAEVEKGVVDSLYFRLPPWWGDNLTLEPEAPFELRTDSQNGDRLLIIRPAESISGQFQWNISGTLDAAPGEPLQVPDVDLVDLRINRYLLLPLEEGGQTLAWETTGLQGRPMPIDAQIPQGRVNVWGWYQVTGDRFQAQRLPMTFQGTESVVQLADYTFSLEEDGTLQGIARLDLEPGERRSCEVQVPPGFRLLRASIAGVPVPLVSPSSQKHSFALGPSLLLQRLEFIFEGHLIRRGKKERQTHELAAPSLVDIPVEKTLWTVIPPPATTKIPLNEDAQILSELEQTYARLESVAALLESAESRLAELDNDEISRWYLPWARHYKELHQFLVQNGSGSDDAHFKHDQLEILEARQIALAERLGIDRLRENIFSGPIHQALPFLSWKNRQESTRSPLRIMFNGPASDLSLRLNSQQSKSGSSFMLRGLLTILLLLVVIGLRQSKQWVHWIRRSPRLALVLVGLAWWLLLSPSILGWVIIMLALISHFATRKKTALQV